MGKFKGSARKDTGRTGKYSDETPKKDYKDYRADYPNDNKEPRKEAKSITDKKIKPKFIGGKSFEVKKQELISHIQNLPEFFENSVKQNIYFDELDKLTNALK